MSSFKLENYATLFFAFIVPLILIIVFAITFYKKVNTDLCNLKYYQCNPPKGEAVNNSPPPPPPPPPANTVASTTATTIADSTKAAVNAIAQAKQNQSGSASGLPQPFANVPVNPQSITSKCPDGYKQIMDIQPDSKELINSYKNASIVFMVFIAVFLLVIGGQTYLYYSSGSTTGESNSVVYPVFFLTVIINLSLLIASAVFSTKGKGTAYEKYTSFMLSFTGFLIGLLAIGLIGVHNQVIQTKLKLLDSESPFTSALAGLAGIALLIFIPCSIYFLTSQKENLKKNLLTFALNNSITDILSILLIVSAIGCIIRGVLIMFKGTPLKIVEGVTQIIACILLVAGIGLYFDYKKQCETNVITCLPTPSIEYSPDRTSSTTVTICKLTSDMNIGSTNVKVMGIACVTIMSVSQIVGLFSYIKSV